MTDRDLVERLREGDEQAFDAIFRSYYPPLVGLAERMLRQRAVAEEIGQEVMLELWKRRESLSFDVSLRAYLFQSVRNRALNQIRHEKVARAAQPYAAQEASVAPRPHAELVQEEIDVALRAGIAELPERCREVFELSRVQGLKYAEIAATMGISVKTVEVQMGKALRLLRERLKPWMEG